jgi:ADP-ribose pyrophosphatase YjhB (NUDIX family)
MSETSKYLVCPKCNTEIKEYKNPIPTADIIIEIFDDNTFKGIVLIERKNYPFGWALPGGFIEYGESAETSAVREAKEETSLDVELKKLFNVYSNPSRDPRHHTITIVYIAEVISGIPAAADDAKNIGIFTKDNLPQDIAFDHRNVIEEYFMNTNY